MAMIFLQGFIKFDKASPRNVPDKIDAEEGRIIRIIIRNRTKTICLTNFVWEP